MQADLYDERVRDKAEEEIRVYPKNLYDRYRSATLHTASHKFKVPKRVWQGLSVVVTLIGILWQGWLFLIKPSNAQGAKKEEQGGDALPAAGALPPLGAGTSTARPLTREEYVQKHKPRVEFQPWSAPAFDDRTVQSQPELYCMASGTTEQDTTCTCVTEQGTKAKISILCAWRSHAMARPTTRIAHHARNRSRVRITRLVALLSHHRRGRQSHHRIRWLRLGSAPWGRSRRRRLIPQASSEPRLTTQPGDSGPKFAPMTNAPSGGGSSLTDLQRTGSAHTLAARLSFMTHSGR